MLVSTFTPTEKRTDNVRSNLHTGQYAGSFFLDHIPRTGTGGGATGAPWGHQTHPQVSLQEHSKKGQWACHVVR